MKNREKKVIILDNISSPFISQAIIILKEGALYEQDNIIKEAEKIVKDYFPNNKKSSKKKNILLFGGILTVFIAIALLVRLL